MLPNTAKSACYSPRHSESLCYALVSYLPAISAIGRYSFTPFHPNSYFYIHLPSTYRCFVCQVSSCSISSSSLTKPPWVSKHVMNQSFSLSILSVAPKYLFKISKHTYLQSLKGKRIFIYQYVGQLSFREQ